jgi:hypothetical protein
MTGNCFSVPIPQFAIHGSTLDANFGFGALTAIGTTIRIANGLETHES